MRKSLQYFTFAIWPALWLGLIFPSAYLQAQTFKAGYVITESGDSLKGYVRFKDHVYNRRNCKFRLTPDSKTQTFPADHIQGYGVDEVTHYRSFERQVLTENEWVFAEYLISGGHSLLYFGSTYLIEKDGMPEILTSKTDTLLINGKMVLKNADIYKKQLLEYLSECPDISGLVVQTDYNNKSLVKLFKAYYECVEAESEDFYSRGSKLKVDLGIMLVGNSVKLSSLGTSRYGADFEDLNNGRANNLSPVALVRISYPRLNSRLAARLGIGYQDINYPVLATGDQSGEQLSYEMKLQARYLMFPLTIHYHLLRGTDRKINPYLFLGFNWYAGFDFLGYEETSTLTGTVLSSNSLYFSSTFFHTRFGTGLSFELPGSLSGFVDFSVGTSEVFARTEDFLELQFGSLNLSLGTFF